MPAAFVGRTSELRLLRRMLDDAVRTRRSGIVVVSGEPGIGKTRLLAQFVAQVGEAAGPRVTILGGKGSPLATTVPYGLIAQACESHLRTCDTARLVALADRWEDELAWVFPSVAAALGRRPAASPGRLALFEGVGALLGKLTAIHPAVAVLDDIHDGDPSTWELVAYLGRNQLHAPVLIVMATRAAPAERGALGSLIGGLAKDGLAQEIRLEPLSAGELAALASGVLGEAAPDTVQWLLDRSKGNALFASSMLEDLARGGDLSTVPRTVRDHVRAALGVLEPEAQALIEAAAVIGDVFSTTELALLVGTIVPGQLDALAASGLITAPGVDSPMGTFEFAHPLVREGIYAALGPERRRSLHRRVGDDPGQPLSVRAAHLLRGALPGDAGALDALLAAAREAEQTQAHREAVTYLEGALEIAGGADPDLRASLLDELSWQAQEVGDHGRGVPALRELIRLRTEAGDPAGEATSRMRLGSFLCWGVAEPDAAEAEARAAISLFEAAGNEAGHRAALNEWGWIRGSTEGLPAQIETAGLVLDLARGAGDTTVVQHALGPLGHALGMAGRTDEGVALTREGLSMATAAGDQAQVEWYAGSLIGLLAAAGRLGEAQEAIAELWGGRPVSTDLIPMNSSLLFYLTGNWGAAREASQLVQALNPGPPPALSAWVLCVGAAIEAEAGRPDRARSLIAQADRVYGGRDLYWFSAQSDWLAGRAHLSLGEPDAARARFGQAARRLREVGALWYLAACLADLAGVMASTGDNGGGAALAVELASLPIGREVPFGQALRLLALGAAAQEKSEAHDHFAAAAAAAARCGATALEAEALERQGLAAGPDGVDALRSAAGLYSRFPATVSERRVTAALRACGAPGRRAAAAAGSLTVREREVATLVVSGLTAKDVAHRLHLSERTVETHLAHVYGKLGITTRHELPDALERTTGTPAGIRTRIRTEPR